MKNELARASSPYLRQHAGNPVHWHSGTRHARARETDRHADPALDRLQRLPLVPRDGAREFENEAIAQAMNNLFLNVKLDREERPDLDRVYQLAHQALRDAAAAGR